MHGCCGRYHTDDLEELELYALLGQGGKAMVFNGKMYGLDVAVKVFEYPTAPDSMHVTAESLEGPHHTSANADSLKAAREQHEVRLGIVLLAPLGTKNRVVTDVHQARMYDGIVLSHVIACILFLMHPPSRF